MTTYTINRVDNKNEGIAREWALCARYGIIRTTHDNVRYDRGSDLDVGDLHISIKASRFSLMAGSLCEGCEDFDGIWNIYEAHVHSNTFAYVTTDYTVYQMNLAEFKQFVYEFCGLERESERNGGQMKIKCRKESAKMLRWLAERTT